MNEKSYLSPSRLTLFNKCKRSFFQKYVFKNSTSTAAMETGKTLHEFIYSVLRGEVKDCIVRPNFGDARLKTTKEKSKDWMLVHGKKTFITDKENEIKIQTEIFLDMNPSFKKNIAIAFEKDQGVEKKLKSDKLKYVGIPDIILPNAIVDIKTSAKADFLEDADNFIKYAEKQFSIQLVMYSAISEDLFKRKLPIYLMVHCSVYPYGIELIEMSPDYISTISDLVSKKYAPAYFDMLEKLEKSFGYNPIDRDIYEGDPKKDWTKILKILGRGSDIKTAEPSWWTQQDAENELGYSVI